MTADLVEDAHAAGYDWNEIMLISRNDEKSQYLNAVRAELNARSIPHTGPGGASDQLSDQKTTDAVITQSIHKSKGTEAPVVILVHASDNMPDGLPADKHVDEAPRGAVDSIVDYYAEERRLFYVAMTRTEEQFHAVAKSGRISRYLQDIQDDYFDRIDHDLPALTGDVVSIERRNQHYRGAFNCDAFDRPLRFAILDWDFNGQDRDADQLAAQLRCNRNSSNER